MAKYIVRFGVMRLLGVFSSTAGAEYRRGAKVIARTERGLEAGEVLCEGIDAALACLKDAAEGQVLRADDGRRHAGSWAASRSRPTASWTPANSTSSN